MEVKPKLPTKRKRRKLIEEQNPSLKITSKHRFTDLPNAIIQHILSFCTVKDAVRFCTLSRQWIFLWTSMSNLSFPCHKQNINSFASFVDKALSLYSSPKLKTFSLEFYYDDRLNKRVKSWIYFALTHGVEELYLHFVRDEALFSSNVIDLFDNWCGMSLKVISLARIMLDIKMIKAIFRGSPLLECFKLRGCCFVRNLNSDFLIDATNTTLKNLILDGCAVAESMGGLCEGWVEIRGPNLVSFTLKGHMWKTKFKLVDVSSLVEANIDFLSYVYEDKDKQEKSVRLPLEAVFEKLLHVNRLAVGDRFLQSLGGENFSTLIGCKILELNLWRGNWCYSVLEFLLQSSPYLEQLIINMTNLCRYEGKVEVEENYWRSKYRRIWCLNHNLKRIEIIGFVIDNSTWDKILLEVVQFLLGNAKVLQKLIIHAQV